MIIFINNTILIIHNSVFVFSLFIIVTQISTTMKPAQKTQAFLVGKSADFPTKKETFLYIKTYPFKKK
jgi:hypothetical protein